MITPSPSPCIMEEPCHYCGEKTEFFEKATLHYYCNDDCQDLFSLHGVKKERKGKSGKKEVEKKKPGYMTQKLWNRIVAFKENYHVSDDDNMVLFLEGKKIIESLKMMKETTEGKSKMYGQLAKIQELENLVEIKNKILVEVESKFSSLVLPVFSNLDNLEEFDETMDKYISDVKKLKKTAREALNIKLDSEFALEERYEKKERYVKKYFTDGDHIEEESAAKLMKYRDSYLDTARRVEKILKTLETKYAIRESHTEEIVVEGNDDMIHITIDEISSTEEGDIMKKPVRKKGEIMEEYVDGMNSNQLKVFNSVQERCRIQFLKNLDNFFANPSVTRFLEACQIIAHFPIFDVLKSIVSIKDKYMRNQFEVGTSGGHVGLEKRKKWEIHLFDSWLYDSFSPHDKVKYGTINWAHSPSGCDQVSRHSYGRSYLVFRDNVKKSRCSYTRFDSSYEKLEIPEHLATYKYLSNISRYFNIREEIAMSNYLIDNPDGNGPEISFMSGIKDYIEVQIHGEILFSRDIEKIAIPKEYNNEELQKLLKDFFLIIGTEIPIEYF